MKKIIILVLLIPTLIGFGEVNAQIFHPVKWSYAAKKTNDKEAVVFLKATIEDGWHIYSAYQKDGGPVKTAFLFTPSKDYGLSGQLTEPKPITKFEKVFNMDVNYFEKEAIFQQKVQMNAGQVVVKGVLEFMVCNDKTCLPPESVSFIIPVK